MNYELINKIAFEKRLSIPKLAIEIGMTKKGLYLAIGKQTLTVATLEKISEVLEVPVTIFFEKDPQTPKTKIEQMEERLAAVEEKLNQR